MRPPKLAWFRDEQEVTSDGTRYDYYADVLVGPDHWSFQIVRLAPGNWGLYGKLNGLPYLIRTHGRPSNLRGQAEHVIALFNRERDTP